MRALSIRQPFAELILRGLKTVEYRSRSTSIVGERFYIYASKGRGMRAEGRKGIKADNIVVPGEALPDWMIELAEQVRMIEPGAILPRGVIVGSAVIENVTEVASGQWSVASDETRGRNPLTTDHRPPTTMYQWHLADVQRATRLRKPRGHPQPVWFRPF